MQCAVALCLHLWCGRNTTVETDWSRAHSEQEIKLLTNWIRNGWPSSHKFHVLLRHMDRQTNPHAEKDHTRTQRQSDVKCSLTVHWYEGHSVTIVCYVTRNVSRWIMMNLLKLSCLCPRVSLDCYFPSSCHFIFCHWAFRCSINGFTGMHDD